MNRGPFTDERPRQSEPPWLPEKDLDPDWRIDHHLIPHSLDAALRDRKEEKTP